MPTLRTRSWTLFACAAAISLAAGSRAADLRVLLTHGGHDFEREDFFAMFDAMDGIETTAVELPGAADRLAPGLESEFDVIVMYDMVGGISEDQQQAFVKLLEKGIGVVSMHHNLAAHRQWKEFPKIIGGKYVFEPETLAGTDYAPSTYSHDEDIDVTIADPAHPITRGLRDFRIHDETYHGYFTAPDAHVLLTTDHPTSDPELAWTTRYGNSRVCYLQLGHDSKAWEQPAFPRFLVNAIRWAATAPDGTEGP